MMHESNELKKIEMKPDDVRAGAVSTQVIDYVPAETIVESKSLKLFLGSFRNHAGFHEDVTVGIGQRLFVDPGTGGELVREDALSQPFGHFLIQRDGGNAGCVHVWSRVCKLRIVLVRRRSMSIQRVNHCVHNYG